MRDDRWSRGADDDNGDDDLDTVHRFTSPSPHKHHDHRHVASAARSTFTREPPRRHAMLYTSRADLDRSNGQFE
ncbi:hypothetical protein NEUTE1DRAFT_52647 [Neurospora tetrasperma FGSC 2508]|uniref:Uncharacterized protein n=1 Tax=Neurospora tetrasperma (strain FGSC 2508 / ATCC MYA-4615 / P0657) TaxID=510951 RepID=F8MY47_NEUT8|nr:uncharacterized protein NEUTE1DRAFT_52647 [Neurospora tetrasperma FGSC 2508]EGO51529.1 hypothetical protein NEUTE1DRAFT_52647 [Neurospora tetrasperma FGSC 2508]EGZ78484.1 hypothetical protein NEUTE2DRAFT_124999 [Neurospora tetrasperma FGSC 2509]